MTAKKTAKKKAAKKKASTRSHIKYGGAWRARFLKAWTACPDLGKACEAAQVTRQTVYNHRKKDPKFLEAMEEVWEARVDTLEMSAMDRATHGHTEERVLKRTVKEDGVVEELVSERTRHDGGLTQFMLAANRKDKYGKDAMAGGEDEAPQVLRRIEVVLGDPEEMKKRAGGS